ncbi:MAG: hypothetical protein IJA52_08290 [Clostridia bacterium]|nr:hypothetical protein [Clostridia bacterium]
MKIDKKTLDMLSSLPDDSLWKMIVTIGNASGIDLSRVRVRPEELQKLRYAMGNLTDEDIGRASEILNSAKKQGKQERNG